MNNKEIKKKFSQETMLLGAGIALLVIFVALIAYTLSFLANNVLPAITDGNGDAVDEEVHFNLEGFEELGL